jgi:AAHS family 4-hydroxybenzoate transporter-like MFS transporter
MNGQQTAAREPIDVGVAVANNRLRGVPLRAWLVLSLVLIIDGFDLALLGLLAPAIGGEFGLGSFEIGLLLGAQQAGVALAGIAGGAAGDRFGRRALIASSVALFGIFTCLAALAQSPSLFVVARVAAGLGLGAIAPNIVSYLTETLPLAWRSRFTAGAFVSLAIGAIACAALVRLAEPALGWRGLFLAGGAIPLLLVPLILLALPESPLWLAGRPGRSKAVAAALNRLVGERRFPGDAAFVQAEHTSGRQQESVDGTSVFKAVPLRDTLALWAIILALQFVGTGMSHMGPTILTGSGIELTEAAQLMVWYNTAGLVGSVVTVWLLPKFGSKALFVWLGGGLVLSFAAMLTLLMGDAAQAGPWLAISAALAGFGVLGLSLVGFPLAAHVYPTGVRATGAGLAAGIGRLGSVLAPAALGFWISVRGSERAFELQIPAALLLIVAALAMQRHIPALSRLGARKR